MSLKEIPGTLGFLASSDGRIISPDGIEQRYYRNGDGYRTVAVIMADRNWVTFGVHRLVALAHLEPNGDPTTLTVNHRDHDITNNRASNLEWVTCKLNSIHASLMNDKSTRPKLIGTMPSGRVTYLYNLVEAAEAIGCSPLEVWDAVKDSTTVNGWKVIHHGSGDPIPKELWNPRIPLRGMSGRAPEKAVKLKDLVTGEIEEFATMNDAARKHGKSASHVYQCITRDGLPRLFLKRYLVVYAKEEFPSATLEQFQDRGSKEVTAYRREDGLYYLFESASQFVAIAKLSKKAVTTRLRAGILDGEIKEVDGWVFSYTNPQVGQQIKAYLERPGS